MFIERQMSAMLGLGALDSIVDATYFPWRFRDVEARQKLKLEDGKTAAGSFLLAASGSANLTLPVGYDPANRLAVFIKANGILRVALTSPVAGLGGTFLLKGTTGSTLGEHPAVMSYQGRTTLLTVSVPAGLSDTQIEYFCFEIPDLDDEASWRDSTLTTGVVS